MEKEEVAVAIEVPGFMPQLVRDIMNGSLGPGLQDKLRCVMATAMASAEAHERLAEKEDGELPTEKEVVELTTCLSALLCAAAPLMAKLATAIGTAAAMNRAEKEGVN